MQEFGSSLGKPSFRGGRRGGDGLVFVNLGFVPKVRNMLGVLRMVHVRNAAAICSVLFSERAQILYFAASEAVNDPARAIRFLEVSTHRIL